MDSAHDDILELLHRSKKLRQAGERLIEEAAELASKANQLIHSHEAHGDGSRPDSINTSATRPA